MRKFPLKLNKSLEFRKQETSFRELSVQPDLIDFSSNDYLGLAASCKLFEDTHKILKEHKLMKNGATGSRLLSGNHALYPLAERELKDFFESEAALIYNSGYDANLGFFASVPQRGDIVLYDELSHASIRDGIKLGKARAFKFLHNNLRDLEEKIKRAKIDLFEGEIFVVTEAVFSMDGDMPELKELVDLVQKYECLLVLDEAHSAGVTGTSGTGLAQEQAVHNFIFARLVTFGKAFGAHGAAILGSEKLKQYLVNFSRSLIYTTALPPHSVATILAAVRYLQKENKNEIRTLKKRIQYFRSRITDLDLQEFFIPSESAIHCCVLSGNSNVRKAADELRQKGFNVKPILSPTVPAGKERLRICLHSFNSEEELERLVALLSQILHSTQKLKNE